MTVWTKGRNFLIVLGACYVIFIACLLQPNVQRNIFYLHRVRWSLKNHGNPAKYGFNSKRAQSFFINDTLHAWHIAPVPHARSANKAASMHLDNSHQLIIYLHGTALTLTASHRLTSYRIFTALPDTHLLAIDYRGFGLSLGVPSENGLIEDGVAAVHWALERGFAKERITLYGQSLGSAVAIGVAHRLAIETQPPIELAKVVTIAAFESGSEIIKTYRLGGVVPILEPLRTYPFVQKWLTDRLQHQWNSLARVEELARLTSIKLTFGHAITDYEIPKEHSERLFDSAVAAAADVDSALQVSIEKTNDGGILKRYGGRFLYREVHWGGHNQVQWDDKLLEDLQR